MLAQTPLIRLPFVATITEVEKLALDLPASQRAVLAAHLLGSLPSVLHDEDEGIAEGLLRDSDLNAFTSSAISLEELDAQIDRRHGSLSRASRNRWIIRFIEQLMASYEQIDSLAPTNDFLAALRPS